MSLILDALQQAEHERGRDRAPELFGPTVGAAAPRTASPPPSRWPWALAAMAVLTAAGTLAWAFWPHPPATHPMAAAATHPAAPPLTTDAALFNPAPAAPAPVNAATMPAASAATAEQPAPPATAPVPLAPVATRAASVPAAPIPATAPLNAEAQAPTASDLPPEVRARLPGLNITGHTYSDNPTLRTLMIDGRMFVEGQALQPGLRLERIGPHRAVFNHQGTRFAVDY